MARTRDPQSTPTIGQIVTQGRQGAIKARNPSPGTLGKRSPTQASDRGGKPARAVVVPGDGTAKDLNVGLELQLPVRQGHRSDRDFGRSATAWFDATSVVIRVQPELAPLVGSFAKTLEQSGVVIADKALAVVVGDEAARQIIAQQRWAALVGETLDTAEVRQLLDLTRQALEARRRNGSLLGLASDRSGTRFPAWQFDPVHKRVRPEVASVVAKFRDEAEDITEATIVSWASTNQPDLDGETPVSWLLAGKDLDRLLVAATRAAARLAQ